MPKDIYINTGTTFQQQYTARQPSIGTAPVTAQYDAQGNASSQTPYIYQSRNPYTFRSPVNAQTPYIANTQQPYPYIAFTQQPYIANAQQPYPYQAAAQNPYPYIAQGRQPAIYQATGRTPSTYANRSPSTTPIATAQGQTPYIANARNPFPYSYQQSQQTPYIANARNPFPYSYQQSQQTPYIANKQTPYPYIAVAFSQAPYGVQTQLGTPAQYQPQDTTNSQGNTLQTVRTAQVSIQEQFQGYITQRWARQDWKILWWVHPSNGYAYCYWYVKRGSTSANGYGTEINYGQYQTSSVYLAQGTVPYANNAWRLVEQWNFWTTNVWPDSVDFGPYLGQSLGLSPVYSQGQQISTAQQTQTLGTNTRPVSLSQSAGTGVSYEGYIMYDWDCEEGTVIPFGGTYSGTKTFVATATKANYPTLTGGTHEVGYFMRLSCTFTGCFVENAQVLLEDNTTKNIQDLTVGEKLIGKDGIVNAVKELRTHDFTDKPMYTINGDLVTTGGHPILTTEGWKSCNSEEGAGEHPELNITELAVGDTLLKDVGNANGDTVEVEVTTVTVETHSSITVYNLDVTDSPSGNDTYVVENYIVHNK